MNVELYKNTDRTDDDCGATSYCNTKRTEDECRAVYEY
jgi:hypothetical protein